MLSLSLLFPYLVNISFFTTGLYILARSNLPDPSAQIRYGQSQFPPLLLYLFLHDYSGSTTENPNLTSCISLNASIVASVFVASRLPSRLHVFAVMLISLQVFLFAPLVTYCIKKFSFGLHLVLSFALMGFDNVLNLCIT